MEHQVKSDSATHRGPLLFPAEESDWELWGIEGNDVSRAVTDADFAHTKSSVLAVPVHQLSQFILHHPANDSHGAEAAAQLQAERLHLTRGGETAILSLQSLPSLSTANDTAYRVDVLEGDAFAEGAPDARIFLPSPLLLPLPTNGIAFWREQSHLVLAVTANGELTYYQSLGKITQPTTIVEQCRSLVALLQHTGLLPADEMTFTNWAGLSAETIPLMQDGIPHGNWSTQPRPTPSVIFPTSSSSALVPVSVQSQRQHAARRRKRKRIAMTIAVLYILAVGGWATGMVLQQARIQRIRAQLAPSASRVENAQQVAKQWRTLQPAIEPEQYPLVWLSKIHAVIPENQSIQLITFEMKDNVLDLRGRAASVDLVFQFQRSLMKHPDLQHYHWSLDNPSILATNEAVFRIKGEP